LLSLQVPLVGMAVELEGQAALVERVAREVAQRTGEGM